MCAVPTELFWTPSVPAPSVESISMELVARVWPAEKLTTLVPMGKALPGKTWKLPTALEPTEVTLTAIALAPAGTPQKPAIGKVRTWEGDSTGPPREPFALRVSTTRQAA